MSDSTQIVNRTNPQPGDLVTWTGGRRNRAGTFPRGRVFSINFNGDPTMVFVQFDDGTSAGVSVLELERL